MKNQPPLQAGLRLVLILLVFPLHSAVEVVSPRWREKCTIRDMTMQEMLFIREMNCAEVENAIVAFQSQTSPCHGGDKHWTTDCLRNLTAMGGSKTGRWRSSISLWQEMPVSADAHCFNAAVAACSKQSWRAALGLLSLPRALPDTEWSNTVRPDAITITAAVQAASKSSPEMALQVLSDGVAVGATVNACAAHAWYWGLAALSAVETHQHGLGFIGGSSSSCNAAMTASPWTSAVQQLRRECISFNATASSVHDVTPWPLVLAWLDEMRSSSVKPDVISFDEALTSSCRSQRWKRVAEIWRRLETSMVESDVMLHNSFMSRDATGGEWPRMLQRMQQMLWMAVLPDQISYGNALGSCTEWLVSSALLAVTTISERLLTPVLDACAMNVVWQEAVALFQGAGEQHAAIDTFCYNALMNVLSKSSQWSLALDVFEGMASTWNLVSFNAALEACRLGSAWQCALQLLQVTLVDCSELSELEADVISYDAVVSACEQARQWEAALQSLRSLQGLPTEMRQWYRGARISE
eukprot:symbB.v1.2.018748.t1/scaffold1508.1/size114708/7